MRQSLSHDSRCRNAAPQPVACKTVLRWTCRRLLLTLLWCHLSVGVLARVSSQDTLSLPDKLPAADVDRVAATETELGKHIAYLASDELRGRDVGTEGLELAAQYIANEFEQAGLETDLFDGTPFQTFNIPLGVNVGEPANNQLAISRQLATGEAQTTTYLLNEAFRPLGIGDSGIAAGPLVFVGYGITAPELDYDDYAGIDTNGAVVMLIRKEPSGREADKKFNGSQNTRHAYFETKIKNAAEHGAVAVLLINDDDSIQQQIDSINQQIAAETERLQQMDEQFAELPEEAVNIRASHAERRQTQLSIIEELRQQRIVAAAGLLGVEEAGRRTIAEGLPVVSFSRPLASQLLLEQLGKSLDALHQEIDTQVAPQSRAVGVTATLQTELSPSEAPSSNVLGVLPGRGRLANETVIVGAHYDHVGMGGVGSLAPGTIAIHNGADDNASGTSVLLASAKQICQQLADQSDHRRVVFIAFTGEERGLLGSEHYVRHPRFALEDTVAMINLDMVGRLRNNDLTVYGTGTAAGFEELVDRANGGPQFALFKVASGYGPSDHQSFYMRKIPVLFFFTGLHNDYHRPSDTIDKINLNGMARITDITTVVAVELAKADQRPQYSSTTRDVTIRQQSKAFLGVTLQEAPAAVPATDTPNDRPAADDEPRGAVVTSTAAGSPAELSGIRAGDRILRIGGVSVHSLSDVIETVAKYEADDVVEITLRRGETVITVLATLQRRLVE